MVVLRSLQFIFLLCLACFLTLQPQSVIAGGGNKHGGGGSGIEILLATGVVAKLLQGRGGGGGFGRSAVPIGGRHYHGPHEYPAQSVRMIVHHPPAPMMQYHHQPQPMMSYPQPAHMYPQQPMVPYQPTEVTHHASTYGNLADFQPKEKTEVIRM